MNRERFLAPLEMTIQKNSYSYIISNEVRDLSLRHGVTEPWNYRLVLRSSAVLA